MPEPLARCVDCHALFRPFPNERPTEEGGVFVYLECPYCIAEFPVASISAKGVELRDRIERMRGKGATTRNRAFRKTLEAYNEELTRLTESADA